MSLLRGPARLILKLLGWKLLDLPQRPAKAVVIAYPHTSNRDFPVTLPALCGDEAADMSRIAACHEGRRGYHRNASPIRLL